MSCDIEDLKPCVPMYGPCTVRDLQPGQTILWCRCGLSKKRNGLWCDGSHVGTGFKPLKWVVPENIDFTGQSSGLSKGGRWSICNCKYTKSPPFCDGTHGNLPLVYLGQIESCTADHKVVTKLCTKCGYVPENQEDSQALEKIESDGGPAKEITSVDEVPSAAAPIHLAARSSSEEDNRDGSLSASANANAIVPDELATK